MTLQGQLGQVGFGIGVEGTRQWEGLPGLLLVQVYLLHKQTK